MIKKFSFMFLVVYLAAALYADVAMAVVTTDYGASFRLRQEYWEKIIDLDTLGQPERDFFRLRSSLWGKVDLNKDLGAFLQVTNEAKYYLGSYKPFSASDSSERDDRFDVDELIIENLYVDAKNVVGLPIDLRIGRQNFLGVFGEGFLILDGTPGDGSRSYYFNAAKATVRIGNNNSVDLVYINQPKKDEFLPSLYPGRSDNLSLYVDNKKQLTASDEEGVVVYGRSKLNDNIAIEPYYIYKEEDPAGTNTKLKLNTVGARVNLTADKWKVRAEYAHQFGEYDNNRDRKGNGGYIFAGQKLGSFPLKPEWEVGYVYLSGDDPTTSDHEGWDPLFSRAPAWNELLAYTLVPETAKDSGSIPGYWTNLHIYKAGIKLALASATNLALSYQYLRADEVTSGLTTFMFSNNSRERGHLGTFMLNHAFTKKLSSFLQMEYFAPGDFYASSAKNAVFARWELQYKF